MNGGRPRLASYARRLRRAAAVVAVCAMAVAVPSSTYAVVEAESATVAGQGNGLGWQASWRSAPQPPLASGPSHDGFANQTVRMVVYPTVGGQAVRVRLSNLYGTAPLWVGKVAVAEQDSGPTVVADTQRVLTFDGGESATIAAGTETVSDAVSLQTQ